MKGLGQLKEGILGKDGDFIKSEDVKNAEKIQKSFEKWIGKEFTLPEGAHEMGKVLRANKVNEPQNLSSSITPQEGLELGTAEAAKFLIRPVEDQNKVAKEQLAEEKKIVAAVESMAKDKTTLKIVR